MYRRWFALSSIDASLASGVSRTCGRGTSLSHSTSPTTEDARSKARELSSRRVSISPVNYVIGFRVLFVTRFQRRWPSSPLHTLDFRDMYTDNNILGTSPCCYTVQRAAE